MQSVSEQNAVQGQVKIGVLASGLGAGILGAGVGVYLAQYLGSYAGPLITIGLAVQIWGVLESLNLDANVPRIWSAEVLYWVFWVVLVVIGALVLSRL